MATKTRSKSSEGETTRGAFHWDNGGHAGALVGAAVAGAAVGLAATAGRRLFMQFTGTAGDWLETLKAEHEIALAIFDKIEATEDDQTTMRAHLLAKLKHALAKHAAEEEMVVYPALREANGPTDADRLNSEHGYVKTYLYELETSPCDSPRWLGRVREFRTMIETHMREEEDSIFPAFRDQMSAEENARLTAMMHKEGLKLA